MLYVPSAFNVLVDSYFEGVDLLFNTYTGALRQVPASLRDELIPLTEPTSAGGGDDLSRRSGVDLVGDGYLIEQSRSERQELVDAYRRARRPSPTRVDALSLTISPTVACNLRCGYCFEAHSDRVFSAEDIDRLRRFVGGRIAEGGTLAVMWFGGEPLAAFDVLKRIHIALKEVVDSRGATLRHSMITNGTLASGRRLDWMLKSGLASVQITVDGPSAVHDRRRPALGGGGSYGTILRNLSKVAPKINTCVRVNVDRSNQSRLVDVLDDLVERGLHKLVAVDLGHVRPYTLECAGVESNALTKQEFAHARLRLIELLIERGFDRAIPDLPRPAGQWALCGADNPDGFAISPGGLVFSCWNEVAREADQASFTLVDDDDGGAVLRDANTTISTRWEDFDPFAHSECATCRVVPLCRGGCPWVAREQPSEGSGDCSHLRWTLADHVRLAHLRASLRGSGDDARQRGARPASPATARGGSDDGERYQ